MRQRGDTTLTGRPRKIKPEVVCEKCDENIGTAVTA